MVGPAHCPISSCRKLSLAGSDLQVPDDGKLLVVPVTDERVGNRIRTMARDVLVACGYLVVVVRGWRAWQLISAK